MTDFFDMESARDSDWNEMEGFREMQDNQDDFFDPPELHETEAEEIALERREENIAMLQLGATVAAFLALVAIAVGIVSP